MSIKFLHNVKFLRNLNVCAAIAVAVLPSMSFATDAAATLPDTGIDLVGTITEVVAALGIIVAAAIGATFGWALLRRGVSWAKSSMKG